MRYAIIARDEKFLSELIWKAPERKAVEWADRLIHEMKNLTFHPPTILRFYGV